MLRVAPLFVFLLLLAVACAPPPPQMPADEGFGEPAPTTSAERERNLAALQELQSRARERRADAERQQEALWAQVRSNLEGGFVTRAHLDQLLDLGPQRFLQDVQLVPALDAEGDAVGFRVAALSAEAARLGGQGLAVDDVLIAVNGESILRPEAFFDAWEALRSADEVALSLLRDGNPMRLDAEVR